MKLNEIIGDAIERDDAIAILKSNQQAYQKFLGFEPKHQEDIITFVQGKKGLTFMSSDKPEELINMFSEALIQMDKNTVKYMIEEQQKELEQQRKELEDNRKELEDNRKELEDNRKELEDNRKELENQRKTRERLEQELAEVKRQLQELKNK